MSDWTRRGFLGTAGLAGGLAGGRAAHPESDDKGGGQGEDRKIEAGARVDADEELPTFRFALEESEGKTRGGSSAREATVKQLPISQGIAGVTMRLEPGGIRE